MKKQKTKRKERAAGNPKRRKKLVAKNSRVAAKRSAKASRPRRKARCSVARRVPRASSLRKRARKNAFGLDRFLGRKPRVTSQTWDRAGDKRRSAALKSAGVKPTQLPAYTGYSWREMQSSFSPGFITKVMSGLKANPKRSGKRRNQQLTWEPILHPTIALNSDKLAATFRKLGFSSAAARQAALRVRKMSNPQRTAFGRKIVQLRKEGYPQKQAVAIAFSEKRRGRLNPARRRGRRNPDGVTKSNETYKMFHGRDGADVFTIKEWVGEPTDTAGLGKLVSLRIVEPEYQMQVAFTKGEQPLLSTDHDANQLYIMGGDQNMDQILQQAGVGGKLDLVDIGEVEQIEYFTHKGFDNYQPIVYFHEFGEEDKKKNPRSRPRRPRLVYSRFNKKLHLVGGAYKIKGVGIVN